MYEIIQNYWWLFLIIFLVFVFLVYIICYIFIIKMYPKGLTKEYKSFIRTGRCPKCKKFHLFIKHFRSDNTKLPFFTFRWNVPSGAYASCKKCSTKTDVFNQEN